MYLCYTRFLQCIVKWQKRKTYQLCPYWFKWLADLLTTWFWKAMFVLFPLPPWNSRCFVIARDWLHLGHATSCMERDSQWWPQAMLRCDCWKKLGLSALYSELLLSEQVIGIKDVIRPPRREDFNDVYIIYELLDTDLNQIIRSNQPLTEKHCQVCQLFQVFDRSVWSWPFLYCWNSFTVSWWHGGIKWQYKGMVCICL